MEKENNLTEKSKDYFDSIAENYDDSHDGKFVNCMYGEIVKRVIELVDDNSSVFDLGCGNGNVTKLLGEKTGASLYGMDLSPKMIEEASKRLEGRAEFKVGDAEKLPYEDNKFDVLICNASFHHYVHPDKVLNEMKRVLKNNGTLILGDPTMPLTLMLKIFNWGLKYSNSGDYHIYGKREIIDMLSSKGFVVSNWKKTDHKTYILNAKISK